MAVPFRKTSKSVTRIRRGNKGLQEPALVKDPTTGEYHVQHQVDEKGFYKGEQVIEVKSKEDKDSNK